ncbi:uncharacterized protein LOC122818175 [Drosophila biarmipes]|uniref:uncharacterized protein LOC122818175 n=1 Tax=Drosophila biarmipes TaxID=125945 RepID=UPI001CDA9634|nr:uncharacterized protein LOC122818175 [Drosophila biarmipes]
MDEREKDEAKSHSQTNSAEDVDRAVSEEALQEREHRSTVYTRPVGISQGTDTKDDPLPPRKRKKIPPAVPAKKHAGGTDSQTEATSADSAASAPRSQPSLLRSASSEFPSSSHSSRREDRTLRTRSLDRDSYSSEDVSPRVTETRTRKFTTRHIDYDTAEVLRDGRAEGKEQQSESRQDETASFHWRPSASSINIQAVEGCVAGVTGFVVTALAMGLLIMISWFIISQMDIILKVVTWLATSLQESMQIFEPQQNRPLPESKRVDDFPD